MITSHMILVFMQPEEAESRRRRNAFLSIYSLSA
jgi:hypothetical protein